jgi:hypothetical protein
MDYAWIVTLLEFGTNNPQLGLESALALVALTFAAYSSLRAIYGSFLVARLILQLCICALVMGMTLAVLRGHGLPILFRFRHGLGLDRWFPSAAKYAALADSDWTSSIISALRNAERSLPRRGSQGRHSYPSSSGGYLPAAVSGDWAQHMLRHAMHKDKNGWNPTFDFWNVQNVRGRQCSE